MAEYWSKLVRLLLPLRMVGYNLLVARGVKPPFQSSGWCHLRLNP